MSAVDLPTSELYYFDFEAIEVSCRLGSCLFGYRHAIHICQLETFGFQMFIEIPVLRFVYSRSSVSDSID